MASRPCVATLMGCMSLQPSTSSSLARPLAPGIMIVLSAAAIQTTRDRPSSLQWPHSTQASCTMRYGTRHVTKDRTQDLRISPDANILSLILRWSSTRSGRNITCTATSLMRSSARRSREEWCGETCSIRTAGTSTRRAEMTLMEGAGQCLSYFDELLRLRIRWKWHGRSTRESCVA